MKINVALTFNLLNEVMVGKQIKYIILKLKMDFSKHKAMS